MSRKLTKIALGIVLAGGGVAYGVQAYAAETCPETNDPSADYKCIYMDVGTSFNNNDPNSTTSAFYELGYTGTLATSIYDTGAVGSKIYDSNITQVLSYYGLTASGNYVTIAGNTVNLAAAPDYPGDNNFDNLNGPSPKDTENYDSDNSFGGIGWALTYNYFFEGELTASGPQFTGGYVDVFFKNWVTGAEEQVLRLNVVSSTINLANLDIYGLISYDWTGGPADIYGLSTPDGTNDCTTPLCQNFFNFQTVLPPDFYTLEGMGVKISWHLDTNVSPPIPQPNQLVQFSTANGDFLIRQTRLDGSVRFAVPEPGVLALLGLGIAGIGGALRKKKAA